MKQEIKNLEAAYDHIMKQAKAGASNQSNQQITNSGNQRAGGVLV